MGNGYDHQSINQFHQKTIFLPMFCRLSIKDIKLNHRRKDPTTTDEPISPKVSCMGQVKRNNRVIGFPSGAAASTAVSTRHHRYSKLKKLFSSKTLLPPATSSSLPAAGRSGSKSCRNSREMCASDRRRSLKLKNDDGDHKCEQDFSKVVNVGQLDPPLPVVKKVAPPGGCGGGEVNIWKRRFNGTTLKSLQIERANLPNSNSQLPPTV